MAIYTYKCSHCEHTFDEILKYEDIKKPESEECPSCHKVGGVKNIIASKGFGITYKDKNKMSESMKESFQSINSEFGSKIGL